MQRCGLVPGSASPHWSGSRWAAHLSGPTNEDEIDGVAAAPDGSLYVTGKFEQTATLGGTELVSAGAADIPLARFDPDGRPIWVMRFGGPGEVVEVPGPGFDSWLTRWTAGGQLDWVDSWGGVGRDFVKGLVHDETSVYAVGPFVGRIDVQGTVLDGGGTTDLLVARFGLDGRLDWATSVQADGNLTGAEVTSAPGGGLLFGSTRPDGLVVRDGAGDPVALDDSNGGSAWLATYRADGSVGWASTIDGALTASPGEIARVGQRIYLDMTVRDAANSAGGTVVSADRKDSAVWAIDIPG